LLKGSKDKKEQDGGTFALLSEIIRLTKELKSREVSYKDDLATLSSTAEDRQRGISDLTRNRFIKRLIKV
jgi:hypothetical protein